MLLEQLQRVVAEAGVEGGEVARRGGVLPQLEDAVAGGVLAVGAGRLLQTLLAGVSPTDFATFGAALGLVFALTALGSLLPALKARAAVEEDPAQRERIDRALESLSGRSDD